MIVFIHHSVNPYRVAFFNQLAKTKLSFTVYFLSAPAKNRQWQVNDFKLTFNHVFLDGWKIYIPGNDHSYFQLNTDVWQALSHDKPSLIITIGWNYLATFIALGYALMLKIPFVTWSESTAYEKSWQRWLTLPLVKFLVRSSTATIAAGSRAKQYLLSLGARADSLYIAWYTVDTTTLTDNSKHITSKQKQQLKSKLNIPDTHLVVLYVGQFIERKGLLQLLQVAASLKNDLVSIICVGYGPLQTKMQTYKKTHSLKNLHIQTYVPNQKIHEFYTLSDVFILLSLEETWGLVVNEAMAAGKPVVVSKYAGSSDDLVKGNGYIVDPNNVEDIAGKIRYMATHPQQRKQMGQKSEKIIATFTLAQNCNVVSEIATTYA